MVSLNLGLSVLILASFLIVYAVFTKFFWRPILHTIRDREEMIQTEIESTKKALKDAEKIRDMQEDVLFTARIEADRIMVEARRSAERIKADIIETAKLETQMILQQARMQAELEKRRVLDSLKQDIAGLTLVAVQKVLRRSMSEEENRRIISGTVEEMIQ